MATDQSISKTLSFWLRHRPDAAGLTLDAKTVAIKASSTMSLEATGALTIKGQTVAIN